MMFKRKVYEELLAWKKEWDGKYACLQVGERFLLSQKDVGKIGSLKLKPIYMIVFLLKDL